MMQTLYQLADEYLAIAQQLADKDLPEEVIADTLEGASGDLEQKAWNIAALILAIGSRCRRHQGIGTAHGPAAQILGIPDRLDA
jgi:hypothetical protein